MLKTITVKEAVADQWDVIIAGSSFAAMFFLHGLPPGTRTLIVEKGAFLPHSVQVELDDRPRETYAMDNRSGRRKEWVAHTMFGGNSNCWWGQVPRFHPNDFRLAERYGVGASWPVNYDMLEPLYDEVEDVMEVAGGDVGHILPRSRAYRFPAHPLSRSDQACIAARPDIWVPVSTARANGGSRATCCANGVCTLCPIDAKFTVQNGIGAFARDEVRLLTDAEARAVDITAGRASGLVVRHAGTEHRLVASTIAVATNAINNAAILLRSGLTTDALGRYLHEQDALDVVMDVAQPSYFGGSSITGHCYGFYDGPHRSKAAAVLIENYNAPNELRLEPGRWTDRMRLKLIAEDLPDARNRVTLAEDGEPHVTWHGHTAYAQAGIQRAYDNLQSILPFEIERIVHTRQAITESHIQGTHRMGSDPATSVVNKTCECHDVRGLYALGAGVFPTSAPANPTLTLSALSLNAARSL